MHDGLHRQSVCRHAPSASNSFLDDYVVYRLCFRRRRKLHLGVDPTTHEIVGCELTDNKTHDCDVIDDVLPEQVLGDVYADGAYDNEKSYEAISNRNGTPFIPPRSGACKINKPSLAMALRNHTVQACWAIGRDNWKKGSVYHQRSFAETAMFRFKQSLARKSPRESLRIKLRRCVLNLRFSIE